MALPASNSWFVSLAGNDSWSGRLALPNSARSDGPVASLERAASMVRARKDRSRPTVVDIAPGRYMQHLPLVFGAADGGDSSDSAVLWRGGK